jgi:type I restriction enzyme S subunit
VKSLGLKGAKLPTSGAPNNHGALPTGWVSASVRDVCSIAVGFAFRSDEFSGSGVRLLRGDNIEPGSLRWRDTRFWSEDKLEGFRNLLVEQGDIILAMDRPIISSGLKLARATAEDVPCLLVQRVARIRSSDSKLLTYIYYNLQSSSFIEHLVGGQTGTQLPHISHSAIPDYRFPLAPEGEQRRIVAKIEELFSDLDAGVAALERVRTNLKRYRASVLKAAVEGKLTEDWWAQHPDTEPASVLLERILTERRRQWEKDQLARFAQAGKKPPKGWQQKLAIPAPPEQGAPLSVPASWEWTKVCDVGEVRLGRQRSPANHRGPHMRPYLRVANVYEDRLDLSDIMEMNFSPEEYLTYRLEPGDILLNEGQSIELVGRPAIYRGEVPGSCFQNTLVRFRARAGLLPAYALIVFRAYLRNQRFQRIARWTVNIAHLGADRFANMGFPLPPLAEQEQIVEEVERSLSIVNEVEAQVDANLKRAARLRQGILKHAFEGRLVPQDPSDEPAESLLERIQSGHRFTDKSGKKEKQMQWF